MNFERNINITFTERAAAVLQGRRFQATPNHQFLLKISIGDLLRLDGCQATFVVFARIWTVSEASETLQVILDLLPADAPALAVVV